MRSFDSYLTKRHIHTHHTLKYISLNQKRGGLQGFAQPLNHGRTNFGGLFAKKGEEDNDTPAFIEIAKIKSSYDAPELPIPASDESVTASEVSEDAL